MRNKILREETVDKPITDTWAKVTVCGGLRLYMADGSIWFHPFTGEPPVEERRAQESHADAQPMQNPN